MTTELEARVLFDHLHRLARMLDQAVIASGMPAPLRRQRRMRSRRLQEQTPMLHQPLRPSPSRILGPEVTLKPQK